MDGPGDYHTKWSKSDRERQIYDIAHMWNLKKIYTKELIYKTGEFPGGPVVKTLHSQCRGPGFDPWSGN